MADGKSRFVDLLISFSEENFDPSGCVPSKSMIMSYLKPNFEFIYSTSESSRITQKMFKKTYIYNLMDGFQFLESCFPTMKDFEEMRWNTASLGFVKKIQSVINQEDVFPSFTKVKQENVLSFDYGKKVCLAKRPKQNSRRINKIKPGDVVIFPFDKIEDFHIKDEDMMPRDWKKYAIYSPYRLKMVEYMCEKITKEKKLYFKKSDTQKFFLWYNGVFETVKPEKKTDTLTERFKNIGEYDFFAIRYMNFVIQTKIEKRKKHVKEEEMRSNRCFNEKKTLYNFELIVFKIQSDDTDLMILSLYFLEFIQVKYNICDSYLPKVIIVHPKNEGKSYHVTYLYLAIKNKLETINKRNITTAMRSLAMSIFSWGSDILPSPQMITPVSWIKSFLMFNVFLDHSLVIENKNMDKEKYKYSCSIDGKRFKIMFLLAYATKHLKEEQLNDLWNYYDINNIDFRGMEMYITQKVNEKKMVDKNKIPSNKTIKARLILTNVMLYSIEHALEIVPGSKKMGLSDIELPNFCFVNKWEEYLSKVKKEHAEKALMMGIITERNCIYFSDNTLPFKTRNETNDLINFAERIYNCFHFQMWRFNTHPSSSSS